MHIPGQIINESCWDDSKFILPRLYKLVNSI